MILWAQKNADEIKEIIANSNDFIRTQMKQEQIEYYVYRLLQTYGHLQNFGQLLDN